MKVRENVIRIRKTLQHINLIQQKSCINIVWVLDRKLCEVESAFVVVFVQIREIRIDPNNFSRSNSIAQKYALSYKEKISSEASWWTRSSVRNIDVYTNSFFTTSHIKKDVCTNVHKALRHLTIIPNVLSFSHYAYILMWFVLVLLIYFSLWWNFVRK